MSARRLSRWQEVRETLATLQTWLDDAQQWSETVVAEAEQESVSGHTESAMAGVDTQSEAVSEFAGEIVAEEPYTPPDLFALLSVLTALRQEVKLQTRSARHDREQANQVLTQLSQTVDQLDSRHQSDAQRYAGQIQEAERTTVDTFVDLHDALSRTAQQSERLIANAVTTLRQWSTQLQALPASSEAAPASSESVETAPPALPHNQRGVLAWLRRGFAAAPSAAVAALPAVEETEVATSPTAEARLAVQQVSLEADRMAAHLEGLAEGYRLNMQRLERVLAAYDIEPLTCLGRPVDAELMEVVQLADDSSQPPGVVVDEIRRGYRRGKRVYRFAQVVATRSAASAARALPDATQTPEA